MEFRFFQKYSDVRTFTNHPPSPRPGMSEISKPPPPPPHLPDVLCIRPLTCMQDTFARATIGYLVGKVSPMYGFLTGLSYPESIFAEKILISCFETKTGNIWKILICKSGMKLHARLKMLLTTKTRVVTISCNTCSEIPISLLNHFATDSATCATRKLKYI